MQLNKLSITRTHPHTDIYKYIHTYYKCNKKKKKMRNSYKKTWQIENIYFQFRFTKTTASKFFLCYLFKICLELNIKIQIL